MHAPKLLYCERREDVEGMWVIVIEYSTGFHPVKLGNDTIEQLRAALKLLRNHADRLIFGDLRRGNILTERDIHGIKGSHERVMLIDFDWCGTAGKARYPSDILLEEDKFPSWVRPGGTLQIFDDGCLFEALTGQEL
jgi:hypothetical protein